MADPPAQYIHRSGKNWHEAAPPHSSSFAEEEDVEITVEEEDQPLTNFRDNGIEEKKTVDESFTAQQVGSTRSMKGSSSIGGEYDGYSATDSDDDIYVEEKEEDQQVNLNDSVDVDDSGLLVVNSGERRRSTVSLKSTNTETINTSYGSTEPGEYAVDPHHQNNAGVGSPMEVETLTDEELARKLQAEWNAETSTSGTTGHQEKSPKEQHRRDSYSTITTTPTVSTNTTRGLNRAIDEKIAKNSSHLHNLPGARSSTASPHSRKAALDPPAFSTASPRRSREPIDLKRAIFNGAGPEIYNAVGADTETEEEINVDDDDDDDEEVINVDDETGSDKTPSVVDEDDGAPPVTTLDAHIGPTAGSGTTIGQANRLLTAANGPAAISAYLPTADLVDEATVTAVTSASAQPPPPIAVPAEGQEQHPTQNNSSENVLINRCTARILIISVVLLAILLAVSGVITFLVVSQRDNPDNTASSNVQQVAFSTNAPTMESNNNNNMNPDMGGDFQAGGGGGVNVFPPIDNAMPVMTDDQIDQGRPSLRPTNVPTVSFVSSSTTTDLPSMRPSLRPITNTPSMKPVVVTSSPTKAPVVTPSPTNAPVVTPNPTKNPTKIPTIAPITLSPTKLPTRNPTKIPTVKPSTPVPTKLPTKQPTESPTRRPTRRPTRSPTRRPTRSPTRRPTRPTRSPTRSPTRRPTRRPTGGGGNGWDDYFAPTGSAPTIDDFVPIIDDDDW